MTDAREVIAQIIFGADMEAPVEVIVDDILAALSAAGLVIEQGWQPIETAPDDQHVILMTSGGHIGEALMLINEDTGAQNWAWAFGPVHPAHKPLGWRSMPSLPDSCSPKGAE